MGNIYLDPFRNKSPGCPSACEIAISGVNIGLSNHLICTPAIKRKQHTAEYILDLLNAEQANVDVVYKKLANTHHKVMFMFYINC